MKKLVLIIVILGLLLLGLSFVTRVFAAKEKVRICHATDSHSNPYSNLEVDQDSVDGDLGNDNGQGDHYAEHNGTVWFLGIPDHSWGDIIPPIDGVHSGKNWTSEGRAFWDNSCNLTSPSPSVEPSPSPSPEISPSPELSPSPNASASATPSTSPTPLLSPTPQPSPTLTVEQEYQKVIEEVKKENGGVMPEIGFK